MAASPGTAGSEGQEQHKKSIVILNMPEEFINREILKTHFEQFGTVERLACSVSKKYAVVHFSSVDEALSATLNGTIIKEGVPPLKIVNRSVDIPIPRQVANPEPATKLVTKRKIVRTFQPSGSGTAAASMGRNQGSSSRADPLGDITDNAPNKKWCAPGPSTSSQPHGSLRSSIKISRPSPFLRKKSFGERSGKPGPGSTKNPSIPPRSKMTLDRRKNTATKAVNKPSAQPAACASEIVPGASGNTGIAVDATTDPIASPPSIEDNSQLAVANTEDSVQHDVPAHEDPLRTDEMAETEQVSTLDIDETTEDAAYNDDADEDDEALDRFGDEIDQLGSPYVIDADQDTQDTAEVSTEEGEIQDDDEELNDDDDYDENQNEDNEEDNDVYESPMKRVEVKETGKPVASSSGGFSFNLSTAKNSQPSSSGPNLFKLPFTSPFALGDAPKPFSSSSFGISLSPGSMSKIFSGSSTAPQVASTSNQEIIASPAVAAPKESENPSGSVTAEKKVEPDGEKSKAPPFGLFSSFGSGSSSTITKPAPFGSNAFPAPATEPKPSTSSTFKLTPTSFSGLSKTAKEAKPGLFSGFKTLTSGPTGRSSSPSLAVDSKLPINVFSGFKPVSAAGSSSATPSIKRSITPSSNNPPVPSTTQSAKDSQGPNPLLLTFTPDTAEAQELFSKRSNNVEERYRILEARDKLIRARVPKTKVNVEHATKLIGTCPDMCPEKERYMRQFQRQLVFYEMLPGQDHVVDHLKAIKAYSRSSADQEEPLPHELRPGPTLDYTMHYLLHYIVPLGDNPDENLSEWYNFLWDRTRSIRKDITQQQIIDHTAVSLYEKCARFHIHCASRLCELDVHSFDPKLNDENLMKCLQSLEHLYEDLRRRQVACPNEPEFRAYQIMMNLNEGDALYNAQQLPDWILNSELVQTALKLHHNIYTRNFVAFFRTVAKLPYMMSCILHRYFFQVRSIALRCFIKSHCTLPKYETTYPMSTLLRMFGYGTAVQSFSYLCESHGIHCDTEDDKVILKRKMFYLPESPSMYREAFLIDSKLNTSVAEAINGSPLPDIDFANRKIHSSFDESGQLIPGSIIGSEGTTAEGFKAPESIVASRSFSKPPQPSATAGFSFGGTFAFKKKEVVQPPKQFGQIEAASEVATSNIIEEVIKSDVTRLTQARMEEAKLIIEQQQADARRREKEAKRKVQVEILDDLAKQCVEQIITQQVTSLVRPQAILAVRQVHIMNEVTESAVANLIDDGVLVNLGISARTELILAKEYYHRLLRNLQRIMARLRARFALAQWGRFTQNKKMERAKEEERKREELWNFPVINPYQSSTKDVYRAFCGNSPVQPSLNKVNSLVTTPEKLLAQVRQKRKSEGDVTIPSEASVSKIPRMDEVDLNQSQQLWDFPPIDSYSRTNRQVLEAFCGQGNHTLLNSSGNVSFGEKRKLSPASSPSCEFKIHKPYHSSVGRGLCREIQEKSNEMHSDLLMSIRSMISQLQDENEKSKDVDIYAKNVEEMNKSCPELNASVQSIHQDDNYSDDDAYMEEDWREKLTRDDYRSQILSDVYAEENHLLRDIKNFARQVKAENAKWRTDTFLNELDLSTLDA